MSSRIVTAAAAALVFAAACYVAHAAATPDYDYFKAKVQPIFLTKRSGHAPCVMCHAEVQQRVPAREASRRQDHLDRRADPQELRHGAEARAGRRRSADEQDPHPPARARGRRRCLPLRRPPVRQQERSELAHHRRLGQGRHAPGRQAVARHSKIRRVGKARTPSARAHPTALRRGEKHQRVNSTAAPA